MNRLESGGLADGSGTGKKDLGMAALNQLGRRRYPKLAERLSSP